MRRNLWKDRIYPFVSPVLFVLCLPLPAVIGKHGHAVESGVLLIVGWVATVSWWANPLYIVSLALTRSKPGASLCLGLTAIALATSAVLAHQFPTNEGGGTDDVAEFGWGYYFWMMAMAVHAIRQASLLWPGEDRLRSLILLIANVALLGFLSTAFLHQSTHELDFSACQDGNKIGC